jgi:hypothetical protein
MMITIRQIERLLNECRFDRLARVLMEGRVEVSPGVLEMVKNAAAGAGLAIIRLDELGQAHTALCGRLIRSLLLSQESDGGWIDPPTSAVALRALLCNGGHGRAVERGMAYLSQMQKSEGIWPAGPLRRMEADALGSAYILWLLGDEPAFAGAVRFEEAVGWFDRNWPQIDAEAGRLFQLALPRPWFGKKNTPTNLPGFVRALD